MRLTQRALFMLALLAVCLPATSQSTTPVTVLDLGGFVRTTSGAPESASTGYGRLDSQDGNSVPSGMAIFAFRQNGVLVTEAAVPASPLIQGGRIYAEIQGAVRTGLAIANPNPQTVTISFFFTDQNGARFGESSTTIPANGQIARFLDEAPFNGGSTITGTFTFTSSLPVGATALRGFVNERSDFLLTTLPVADLASPTTADIVFSHFADGGGWTTQVVLVNPSDFPLEGTIKFSDSVTTSSFPNSISTTVALNTFSYSIPPRSARKLISGGLGLPPRTGWVSIKPRVGSFTPSSVVIFSFRQEGITVTEAGVPPVAGGKAFRLYAEASGDFEAQAIGSIESGLVVSNAGTSTATVDLALTTLTGEPTGLSAQISVLPNGQVARFLKQIDGFEGLPVPFQGILRITTSATAGVTVAGLRGRYNERKDFLIATTSPVDENASPVGTELVFPHLADGGGFTTQLILFDGGGTAATTGNLSFSTPAGTSLDVRLLGDDLTPAALALTQLSATPGDVVVLRADDLDPAVATFATFEFGTDRSIDVPVRSVNGNDVEVAVPFFIDPESLELPSSVGDPGQITLQVLDQLLSLVGQAPTQWARIEEAAAGGLDAASVVAALETTQSDLLALRQQVAQVVAGQTQRVTLSSGGVGNVVIDRDVLALMDRIFVAYASDMLSNSALETAQQAKPAGSGFGLFWHGITVSIDETSKELLDGVRDFTTLSGIMLGVLALAAVVGGSAALVTFATIAAPVILIASIAAGGAYVYHQETQTDRILGDRFADFDPCDVDFTPIGQLAAEGAISLALNKAASVGTTQLMSRFGYADAFIKVIDEARGALLAVAPNPIAETGPGTLLADKTKCLEIVTAVRNKPPPDTGDPPDTTDPPDTDPPDTTDPPDPPDTTDPPDPPDTFPGPVETVQVFSNPDLTGFLSPGTRVQFSAVARDANGTVVGCTPQFAVSNPIGSNVATIDATGLLIMGPDQGAVSVTATCNGVTNANPILVSGSGSGPPDTPSASPFDGVYIGTYVGTGAGCSTCDTFPVDGPVQFTVANGGIAVNGGGTGVVGALGSTNFSTSGSAFGGLCTYTGNFSLGTGGSASANGNWSCSLGPTRGSGTWNATKQ